MGQVLVVTAKDDPHADAVIRCLTEISGAPEPVRLNTASVATNTAFAFAWDGGGNQREARLGVRDSGRRADKVRVIWFRKPVPPEPHPAAIGADAQACSAIEYRSFVRSLEGLFPAARWVNDYWRMHRYSSKFLQFDKARDAGFALPPTLLSNDLAAVRRFATRHGSIVIKALEFPGFEHGGAQYGTYTSVVDPEKLEYLTEEEVALAPAVYQAFVEKAYELRVTVIGDEVFPCRIDTVPGTPDGIDWRSGDIDALPHSMVQLSIEARAQILFLMASLGLRFGALDFIVTPSGDMVFLEVNTNGQYLWIEHLTGAPLSMAMAKLIASL